MVKQSQKTKLRKCCEENKTLSVIVSVGTACVFCVLCIVLIWAIMGQKQPEKEYNGALGALLWNSVLSTISLSIGVVDIVVAIIISITKKDIPKWKVVSVSAILYVICVFDEIAIKYPFHQGWVAVINLVALAFMSYLVLFQSSNKADSMSSKAMDNKLKYAIRSTDNRKIIAIQMYRVISSYQFDADGKEKIIYSVEAGERFVRSGNDVNGIAAMTYEVDRTIVDSFEMILNSYHDFLNSGNEDTKNKLIDAINIQKNILFGRLNKLQSPDSVTKEDCCIARILVMYLSFLQILSPKPEDEEPHADYIGEVSLCDGDLQLDVSIENRLFTLVRTGLFGAAVLGTGSRHVFCYKKDGTKQGRKYCASQLRNVHDSKNGQVMDICLFTVESSRHMAIPGYILKSISMREAHIQKVLNKMVEGDEVE